MKEEDKVGKTAFHKGPDPISAVRKAYPYVQITMDESASLSLEELKRGFDKMNAKQRRKWLRDIKSGHFKMLGESGEGSQEVEMNQSDDDQLEDAESES